MPQTDTNLWTAIANFGVLILAALGLKGRIDALAATVIYKDTCKVCGGGLAKELALLREAQERQHEEQMALIKTVHQNLPKRRED